jgi:hypothetical protein
MHLGRITGLSECYVIAGFISAAGSDKGLEGDYPKRIPDQVSLPVIAIGRSFKRHAGQLVVIGAANDPTGDRYARDGIRQGLCLPTNPIDLQHS